MNLRNICSAALVLAIVLTLAAPGAPSIANAASAPPDARSTIDGTVHAPPAPATPADGRPSAWVAHASAKPGSVVNKATPRVLGEIDRYGTTPAVYIVQLTGAPLASYRGDVSGLAPTSPSVTGASLNPVDAASAAYLAYLGSTQATVLAAIEQELGRAVEVKFTYAVAFNGYALILTPGEAERVLHLNGVQRVERDSVAYLQTDEGPTWIGAPSLWADPLAPTFGAGVVVGMIDTGINFGNASFARVGADGYIHENPRGTFFGVCDPDSDVYDPAFVCNEKLIGGWDFADDQDGINEADGPEDNNGHGSHTASTAAGNFVAASLVAPTLVISGSIKGVAPHANLIAYDACLPEAGCELSALVAAINQAVTDDVDVINYSIGGGSANPWSRSDAIAFLAAYDAGIFVAVSAGNSGPQPLSMASPANAPWVTAVGASTHDRRFANKLIGLTGGDTAPPADIDGQSITSAFGPARIVDAATYVSSFGTPDPRCEAPFDEGTFGGEIVVCVRGGASGRVQKGENVLAGGAGGMVLVNDEASSNALIADTHVLPAVNMSYADGLLLKAWLASGEGHTGMIAGTTREVDPSVGDMMASFSSRGPDANLPTVIKPDVAAPGASIFAAYKQPQQVAVISGTSMASPHVAGAAALLAARHPDWSPGAIRSALMMAGIMTVKKEDGVTPADAFDIGAGRIDLAKADAVGFVLDESAFRFETADPATGGDPTTLNLASLAQSACLGTCTWTRTLRSVRDVAVAYAVTAVNPVSMTLTVTPESFTLDPFGTQVVTITADVRVAAPNAWMFGAVNFGATELGAGALAAQPQHFPVAVMSRVGSIPEEISTLAIDTRRNSGLSRVSGLRAVTSPTLVKALYVGATELITGAVAVDPTNDDPYDIENGGVYTTLVQIADPPPLWTVVQIAQSTANDLDLYVGIDANGDGIPTPDEEICRSTMGSYLERCELEQPAAGAYWILIQNYQGSGAPVDTFLLEVTKLSNSGQSANFYVTGPATTTAGVPFEVQLHWDFPNFVKDTVKYAYLELGTSAATPNDIASLPVRLTRLSDDAVLTEDAPTLGAAYVQPGDLVTFTLDLEPEPTAEGPVDYTITTTLPAGLSYVPGTAALSSSVGQRQVDPVVNGDQLVWHVANVATTPVYVMSTNAPQSPQFDAGCATFQGGFVHLREFGIPLRPEVTGNGHTWSVDQLYGSLLRWSFWGRTYPLLAFTDDALLSVVGFDPSLNSGINAPIPTAALPNNLLAPYWADFKVVYDVAKGTGVRIAGMQDDSIMIIEYDGLQRADGQAASFDVEAMIARQPNPYGPEIVFAYDNITGTLPAGVVGLEDAAGTDGVPYLDAINDGLLVCYDWKAGTQRLTYQTRVKTDAPLDGVLTTVVESGLSAPETGVMQTRHDLFVTGVTLSTRVQGPALVAPGYPISYTITVSNTGRASAQNITVVAQIPAGSTYGAGGTYQGGFVRFTIPTLAAGAQTAVVFSVMMQAAADALSAANVEVPSIVGGKEAQPGAWPWQVALWDNRSNAWWGCGASLIARNWVLTAAHCVITNQVVDPAARLSVVMGRHDLSTNEGQRIQVSQVIVHPDYNQAADDDSDIALLRLAQPAALTTTVQIVPLAGPLEAAALAPGTQATVTGWGTRTSGEEDYPNKLYQVTVPIVDQAACIFSYGALGWEITDNMLCAGLSEGGKDSCQGDSGGPLVVPVGAGWKLAGIVSTGNECALPLYPGIYTRVPNFVNWVDDEENSLLFAAFMAADGSGLPGHSTVGENSVTTLVRSMRMLLPTIRR